MDTEERARRQSRRVIISEVLMVVTVIATVLILAFIVSGYWVGSDFKIERQGLLQIYSTPTGADIDVDGNPSSWLQRTNTSKTLAAGEHTIKLTKEGYDSWSRTINITEGLLYRLHYPRLFLENRQEESAFDFSANFASVSPDRNTMVLGTDTTNWQLANLDTTEIKPQNIDFSGVDIPSGTISRLKWASDNEHILVKINQPEGYSWVVINIKNPSLSFNLTKEFNANFEKVDIIDSSASSLLVVLDHNLHRVDILAKQISAVLVSDVESYDYFEQNVVFVAKNTTTEAGENPYMIGSLKLSNNEITNLKSIPTSAKVLITKFYDDEYIGVIDDQKITLYLKNDFSEKNHFDLAFRPSRVKVGNYGEDIIMYTGGNIMSLDMEAMELTEWSTDTETFGWLDGSMIYAVKDGNLVVYDFNGLNQRQLATDVSSQFPATITADKYLYYFRDGSLIRGYL